MSRHSLRVAAIIIYSGCGVGLGAHCTHESRVRLFVCHCRFLSSRSGNRPPYVRERTIRHLLRAHRTYAHSRPHQSLRHTRLRRRGNGIGIYMRGICALSCSFSPMRMLSAGRST